mmetsp:Transcript_1602/g.5464  ORF Transcript_1602/g.5464 Transcript_1602/m.5464 type:complete len:246 (+) Transcript_1602:1572-2309(+)
MDPLAVGLGAPSAPSAAPLPAVPSAALGHPVREAPVLRPRVAALVPVLSPSTSPLMPPAPLASAPPTKVAAASLLAPGWGLPAHRRRHRRLRLWQAPLLRLGLGVSERWPALRARAQNLDGLWRLEVRLSRVAFPSPRTAHPRRLQPKGLRSRLGLRRAVFGLRLWLRRSGFRRLPRRVPVGLRRCDRRAILRHRRGHRRGRELVLHHREVCGLFRSRALPLRRGAWLRLRSRSAGVILPHHLAP